MLRGSSGLLSRFLGRRSAARFGPVVAEPRLPAGPITFRASELPSAGPVPWLDRPGAEDAITMALRTGRINAREASLAEAWVRDGVVILDSHFAPERLDKAWSAYESALESGTVAPDAPATEADPLPGRTLNPHFVVPELDALLRDPSLVELVSMLFGAEALPFQTIAGHKGSEQKAHSDAIHMTSYPLGYLTAAWAAFEDISAESGPLIYYPGSHRLPYIFSECVGISRDDFRQRGYVPYHERYEPRIAELIAEHALKPRLFTPRKGDVLLWHANLLHGGSPRARVGASRRALVCHYFARGCVTYHDLAATPSHLFGSTR